MRIVFDQGTPAPLRRVLSSHDVSTVFELGWSTLGNGALLDATEREFDLLITTDRNIRYQQNLVGRRIAIIVLPTTSWPRIRRHVDEITRAVDAIHPGEYREVSWED